MTDRDVEAAVEAGVLAAGMENARNKRRPAHVLAASQDGGKDFKSEVEWLLQVVRAPLPSNPSCLQIVSYSVRPVEGGTGMSVADAGTVRLTKVARILTEVFAPPILVVTLLVVVGIHSTSSIGQGLLLSAVAAFFAAGLPYAIMLVGIRRGRLSDRHLSLREQRPAMMIIGLVSVSVGLLFMVWLDAPREFLALVAAMVAGVGVALAISSFWKISIHAACAAGTVAVLVIVFGWVMLIWVPVVAAICWARVVLGDHTGRQVIAGAAVGALVAAGVMSALA